MNDNDPVRPVRVVGLPDPTTGALTISQRLPAPDARGEAATELFSLPRPVHPQPERELVIANLLLPEHMSPTLSEAAIGEFDTSTTGLWRKTRSGLSVPTEVAGELELSRAWRTTTYVTPATVGLDFGSDRAAAVAWAAFAHMPPEIVAYYVAAMAAWCDPVAGSAHRRLAREMQLPAPFNNAVVSQVGSDGVLFDSRCLRWVVCELAAARTASTRPRPPSLDREGEQLLAWLFPLARHGLPARSEVIRALFLLHDGYEVGGRIDAPDSQHDLTLALSAAYSHGVRFHSSPDDRLGRWHHIWTLPDDHPLLADLPRGTEPPSRFRRVFRARTGLDVDDWFTVCTILAIRHRARMLTADADVAPLDRALLALPDDLHRRVTRELRHWLSTDLRTLGKAIHRELRDDYRGYGSVPTHTMQLLSERPFLRTRRGALIPLGGGLVADRIGQLPAITATGVVGADRRQVRSHLGPMMEARIRDILVRIEDRHWVADDTLIVQLFGREKRPDIVAAQNFDYLVLEIYNGELAEPASAGELRFVRYLCRRYQDKADQARHAVVNINRLANARGLDTVGWVGFLVVVEEPLWHSPALARELEAVRPGEPSKFVISVDELEHAVALAERGWALPQLVAKWQSDPIDCSFGAFLEQYERLSPIRRLRGELALTPLRKALERTFAEAS